MMATSIKEKAQSKQPETRAAPCNGAMTVAISGIFLAGAGAGAGGVAALLVGGLGWMCVLCCRLLSRFESGDLDLSVGLGLVIGGSIDIRVSKRNISKEVCDAGHLEDKK